MAHMRNKQRWYTLEFIIGHLQDKGFHHVRPIDIDAATNVLLGYLLQVLEERADHRQNVQKPITEETLINKLRVPQV